jgi:hypothetical protein
MELPSHQRCELYKEYFRLSATLFICPWKATCAKIPNTTLPYGVYPWNIAPRAINSGTLMGSVTAVRSLFKDLTDELLKPDRGGQGDQGDHLTRFLNLLSNDQLLQEFLMNSTLLALGTYPSITVPGSSGPQPITARKSTATSSTGHTTSIVSSRMSYTHLCFTMGQRVRSLP